MFIYLDESTAALRRVLIYMVDEVDGYTPETGILTPTVEISKNGAAQAAGAGSWAEIGDGLYYYQLTAGEVDTEGFLSIRIVKAAVSREFNKEIQIITKLETKIDSIITDIKRLLGLVQENHYIDQTVFTGFNLTSARIRIYSVPGSVGTGSDVLATYQLTATYSGGNLGTYKVVKV